MCIVSGVATAKTDAAADEEKKRATRQQQEIIAGSVIAAENETSAGSFSLPRERLF